MLGISIVTLEHLFCISISCLGGRQGWDCHYKMWKPLAVCSINISLEKCHQCFLYDRFLWWLHFYHPGTKIDLHFINWCCQWSIPYCKLSFKGSIMVLYKGYAMLHPKELDFSNKRFSVPIITNSYFILIKTIF